MSFLPIATILRERGLPYSPPMKKDHVRLVQRVLLAEAELDPAGEIAYRDVVFDKSELLSLMDGYLQSGRYDFLEAIEEEPGLVDFLVTGHVSDLSFEEKPFFSNPEFQEFIAPFYQVSYARAFEDFLKNPESPMSAKFMKLPFAGTEKSHRETITACKDELKRVINDLRNTVEHAKSTGKNLNVFAITGLYFSPNMVKMLNNGSYDFSELRNEAAHVTVNAAVYCINKYQYMACIDLLEALAPLENLDIGLKMDIQRILGIAQEQKAKKNAEAEQRSSNNNSEWLFIIVGIIMFIGIKTCSNEKRKTASQYDYFKDNQTRYPEVEKFLENARAENEKQMNEAKAERRVMEIFLKDGHEFMFEGSKLSTNMVTLGFPTDKIYSQKIQKKFLRAYGNALRKEKKNPELAELPKELREIIQNRMLELDN